MPDDTAIRIEDDPHADAAGLAALLSEAWKEAGRAGGTPAGWRPFDPAGATSLAARTPGIASTTLVPGLEGRLEAYAAVRPAEGMDMIDFLFVRQRAREEGRAMQRLLEACVERLRAHGRTRIIYAGFGWWRSPFPDLLAEGFRRAGFGRFEGVFLSRPLDQTESHVPALVPGYRHEEWRDDRFDEVCALMLRSPEPEALYWDIGLCRRSIHNAGHPVTPLFRDGFGQLVVRERDGRVVAFTLATTSGYVNHVYTDEEERGRGIGAAMLGRLLAALARGGLAQATILTHETNPRAIAVYERLGFQIEFRFPQFWLRW